VPTDEQQARYDPSVVGVEVPLGSREISAEDIRTFCEAVGETNPLYLDPTAAALGSFGAIVAPPAMLATLSMGQGLDPKVTFGNATLNGGQRCEFRFVVRVGDAISATTAVSDIFEKTGRTGRMLFVVRRTTYTNQYGEVVAVIENSTVHREIEG
jgi:acyl dehydratase